MSRAVFQTELAALIKQLQPTIREEYRAYDDSGDSEPSMLLTVGVNSRGWGWQTGDTSFHGAAYGYQCWGQTAITRDSDPTTDAAEILADLEGCAEEEDTFFYDEVQS